MYGTDYDTPDGTCVRDYIHVNDLADAHIRALEYLEAGNPSDVFNLGNGSGHSVRQIIDIARAVTGRDINVDLCRPPPRRSGNTDCRLRQSHARSGLAAETARH